MRKVMQYRYYNAGNNLNQPKKGRGEFNEEKEGITRQNLVTGALFTLNTPIMQLGIQTMPGVKFYVNNSTDPIIVGPTGIYELDLDNNAQITSLAFNNESLAMIENNETGYLIIDTIYEDGKE